MGIVSIRGAITVDKNTKDDILEATEFMVSRIVWSNHIALQNIIQIHFSATKDLDAIYPAVAARHLGITSAALMCFQEMNVMDSLEKCIRVDVLVEQDDLTRDTIKHQYLRGAQKLRPDLVKE